MWHVVFGRHWIYLPHKVYRYETAWWILAVGVYWWWHFRYSLSVYPVRYVKIYRTNNDIPNLRSYEISYLRRKGRK